MTFAGTTRKHRTSDLRRRKPVAPKEEESKNSSIISSTASSSNTPVPTWLKVEEWSSSTWSKDDADGCSTANSIRKSPAVRSVDHGSDGKEDLKKNIEVQPPPDDSSSEEDDDSASVSSLDSFSSESQPETQHSDDHSNKERLEKRLKIREESLARLQRTLPVPCYNLLAAHEKAAQVINRNRCRLGDGATMQSKTAAAAAEKKGAKPTNISTAPQEDRAKSSHSHPVLYTWWWCMFEFYHTGPAAYKLVVVCLCHLFFHGTLDTLSRIVYHSIFVTAMGQGMFDLVLISLGLGLLRSNGYLWMFLDTEKYNAIKFDMHNRRQLGFADARLLSFLESSLYGSAANLLGFYLVYIGLSQISSQEYERILKFLEAWYLAKKDAIIQDQNLVEDELHFYSWESIYNGFSEKASDTCLLLSQNIHPRFQWWFSYCCNDPAQEWKAIEMVFYSLGLVAITFSASMVGVNILEICNEE